jgi:gas vesicle protein
MKGIYSSQLEEPLHAEESTLSFMQGLLGGLFIGGVVSAGAMLLSAPRSGRRTRAHIQHEYEELRDQLLENLEDAEEEVLANAHRTAATIRGKVKELQHH